MNGLWRLLPILIALLLSGPVAAQTPAAFLIEAQHAAREPLDRRLAGKGLTKGRPVFIRIYKREHRLELYMRHREGRWVPFETYRICTWSGRLGPKLREGDGQAPEGFYVVGPRQLKPDSQYHRAFNLGFPNAFDRANGRTGSFLMVHGDCVSIGCYAMTDAQITEIYGLVEAALRAGQRTVPVEAYPFAMTETNLRREQGSAWAPFWTNLAEGARAFDRTGQPATAYVCGRRYGFSPAAGCRRIAPWP